MEFCLCIPKIAFHMNFKIGSYHWHGRACGGNGALNDESVNLAGGIMIGTCIIWLPIGNWQHKKPPRRLELKTDCWI